MFFICFAGQHNLPAPECVDSRHSLIQGCMAIYGVPPCLVCPAPSTTPRGDPSNAFLYAIRLVGWVANLSSLVHCSFLERDSGNLCSCGNSSGYFHNGGHAFYTQGVQFIIIIFMKFLKMNWNIVI